MRIEVVEHIKKLSEDSNEYKELFAQVIVTAARDIQITVTDIKKIKQNRGVAVKDALDAYDFFTNGRLELYIEVGELQISAVYLRRKLKKYLDYIIENREILLNTAYRRRCEKSRIADESEDLCLPAWKNLYSG